MLTVSKERLSITSSQFGCCSGNWTNSYTCSAAFVIECAFPRHQNDLNVAVEAPHFILPQPNFRHFCSHTTGVGWNPSVVSLSVLCNTRQIILLALRRECILQVSIIQVSILPADFTRHCHHSTSACSLPDYINTPSDTVDCIQFHSCRDITYAQLSGERKRKETLTNKHTS